MNRAALAAALAALALLLAAYAYLNQTGSRGAEHPQSLDPKSLEEALRRAYARDPEFRSAVDELRRMTLDPDAEFDKDKAVELFNKVLAKVGLPGIPYSSFRWGKSVSGKAQSPPAPRACAPPPPGLKLTLVQPAQDAAAGNGVVEVFACSRREQGKTVVEVTVVFGGERSQPPGSESDYWYDAWRFVAWGRVKDIETFFIVLADSGGYASFQGLALVLDGTLAVRNVAPAGSGGKGFAYSAHEGGVEALAGLDVTVYVNTWNHAFSLADANPGLAKVAYTYTASNVTVGSRVDAENKYSDLKYAGAFYAPP